MIVEGIMSVLFKLVRGLLSLLPDISWDSSGAVIDVFMEFISLCFYFIPVNTVISILAIVIIVNNFKIAISLLKTIWQILPFA